MSVAVYLFAVSSIFTALSTEILLMCLTNFTWELTFLFAATDVFMLLLFKSSKYRRNLNTSDGVAYGQLHIHANKYSPSLSLKCP